MSCLDWEHCQSGRIGSLAMRETYALYLPDEEPPEHVLEALRVARDWIRDVEARKAEEKRLAHQRLRELMEAQVKARPVDWRDKFVGNGCVP